MRQGPERSSPVGPGGIWRSRTESISRQAPLRGTANLNAPRIPPSPVWRLGGLEAWWVICFACLFVYLFCFVGYVFIACSPVRFYIHECDGIYRYHAENHVIFAESSLNNQAKTILGGSWGSKIEENCAERPQDRSKRVARGVQSVPPLLPSTFPQVSPRAARVEKPPNPGVPSFWACFWDGSFHHFSDF